MNLYVGNIEKWNQFFKQFTTNFSIDVQEDISHLISNQFIKNIKDFDDFLNANVSTIFNNINKFKNFGKINKKSSFLWYRNNSIYTTTMECIIENNEYYVEDMNECNIQKYINFKNYSINKKNIRNNLNDVYEDYIRLLEKSHVLSNDEAYHEIIFIPYGKYYEIWLMNSSAELYRFRSFAEMIIVHTISSYLGYEKLEELTLEDLNKYNADLILNLELLQQSDLPRE